MRMVDEVQVQKVLRGLEIPPCPAILTQLLAEMRNPQANAAVVAQLIAQDPGIAAGVVKLANSPVFSAGHKVSSVGDALGRVGFANVLNMAVSEVARKHLSLGDAVTMERFWDNAAYTAQVCASLAGQFSAVHPDVAYTFGLFHDCGIPIMMKRFRTYAETLEMARRDGVKGFTQVEEERHRSDHAVIGSLLVRSWGLPQSLVDGVLCHHDYAALESESSGLSAEAQGLIALVVIAEQVVGQVLNLEHDCEWEKARASVACFLEMDVEGLQDLVEEKIARLEAARQSGRD